MKWVIGYFIVLSFIAVLSIIGIVNKLEDLKNLLIISSIPKELRDVLLKMNDFDIDD